MELTDPCVGAPTQHGGDALAFDLRAAMTRAYETRCTRSCEDARAVRRAFVAGELKIIDRFAMDAGGCLLARRRSPSEGRVALTEHEAQVLESVVSGCGNKQCAVEIGLAVPTVAFHLARAMAKVGVGSRVELVRLFVALDAGASTGADDRAASPQLAEFVSDGTAFLMVWLPSESPRGADALTRSEREVLTRLLEGDSSAAIAYERCTSARTVANQIASIFRKLGVRSRGELAAMR